MREHRAWILLLLHRRLYRQRNLLHRYRARNVIQVVWHSVERIPTPQTESNSSSSSSSSSSSNSSSDSGSCSGTCSSSRGVFRAGAAGAAAPQSSIAQETFALLK